MLQSRGKSEFAILNTGTELTEKAGVICFYIESGESTKPQVYEEFETLIYGIETTHIGICIHGPAKAFTFIIMGHHYAIYSHTHLEVFIEANALNRSQYGTAIVVIHAINMVSCTIAGAIFSVVLGIPFPIEITRFCSQ